MRYSYWLLPHHQHTTQHNIGCVSANPADSLSIGFNYFFLLPFFNTANNQLYFIMLSYIVIDFSSTQDVYLCVNHASCVSLFVWKNIILPFLTYVMHQSLSKHILSCYFYFHRRNYEVPGNKSASQRKTGCTAPASIDYSQSIKDKGKAAAEPGQVSFHTSLTSSQWH